MRRTRPLALAIVTTSRSDFGLLAPIARQVTMDARFRSRVLITGQHLLARTPRKAELAGLDARRLPRPRASMGLVHQVALRDALCDLGAEALLVLGDRYELLEVALVATVQGVVLAHCSGGERTLGSFDDLVRDALSKLAHLHFPAHAFAGARLKALGEEAWRICVSGEPGLDSLLSEARLTGDELEALTGMRPGPHDLVVALHPPTRHPEELNAALDAVEGLAVSQSGRLFLSSPNGDPGSERIAARWRALARRSDRCHALVSLGSQGFRSLVASCGALVGNSSAGLVEAPSLGTPSVDVGTRQSGRLRGDSVISCPHVTRESIGAAVRRALELKARGINPRANPYGDGHAVPRILDHLATHIRRPSVLVKT